LNIWIPWSFLSFCIPPRTPPHPLCPPPPPSPPSLTSSLLCAASYPAAYPTQHNNPNFKIQIFKLIFFTFFTYFLHEPFRDKDILDNLSFINSSDLNFECKRFFFVVLVDILSLDPDPWIRIFLQSRIQEAKMLRSGS